MDYGLGVKAWVVRENGPPEVMSFEEVEPPDTPPGLVQVEVRAAAINFFDLLQIGGTYQVKPELPFIPGAEVAGIVASAPPGSGLAVGDRVMATVPQQGLLRGGYAEVTHADVDGVVRIPERMPFDEAAGFFINYQTGWFGLHRRARLTAGEVVLVHAGAGGVGSAAIQLAKAAGAAVIATAGSPEKVELCRKLGADLAVDYSSEDFVEAVKQFTQGRGADVVYDPVGGDVFDRSTKCIAFEGRIVVVGFTSGRIPTLAANHVLVKNYSVVGLHWGLYRERLPALIPSATDELFRLYEAGSIRPHIGRRAALGEALDLLQDVGARRTTGKSVLVVGSQE
jgi:NADPH2:quinone reductase